MTDIPDTQTIIDQATAELRALQQRQSPTKRQRKGEQAEGNVNRMRWAMLNRFVDRHMKALPVQAAACWLALFRHADGSGHVARSHTTLVQDTRLSRWGVRKGINALKAKGLVRVELKGNNVNGKYTTTRYKLEK